MGRKKIEETDLLDTVLGKAQPEQDAPPVAADSEQEVPTPVSLQWQDYVMSQFTPDEVVDEEGKKFPRVDGLWRVCELLIGQIIESYTEVVQPDTNGRVTVTHTIVLRNDKGLITRFTEAADVHATNTQNRLLAYPTAYAGTRALGRALRRALRLRTCAYEEKEDRPAAELELPSSPEFINGTQRVCMQQIAARSGIDLQKFLRQTSYGPFQDLSQVPYETAKQLINVLNKMQQSPNKIPVGIRLDGEAAA